jgi:copper chaperone CopZ
LPKIIYRKDVFMTEPNFPQEEKNAVAILKIGGMHCPACSSRVTKALKELPGVLEAEVSLETNQAKVIYIPGEITPVAFQQAVIQAGYTVEGVTEK